MADRTEILGKLVALKKQREEQRVYSLERQVRAIEDSISLLTSELQALDDPDRAIDSAGLSQQGHFVQSLLNRLDRSRAALHAKRQELLAARHDLKSVFHSESELQRMGLSSAKRAS